MNECEKFEILKAMVGKDESDIVLRTYLSFAGKKILNKAFPFETDVKEVPDKYSFLQCEIAAYLINKRGAEGEISHSENGISRSYEAASVPDSMLKTVIPFVGVLHNEMS